MRSVQPFPSLSAVVLPLIASLVVSACATCPACAPAPPFRGYAGPELPDENVAVLDWSGRTAAVLEIGGRKTVLTEFAGRGPQTQARLLPGLHTIRYGGTFGGSVLLGPALQHYDLTALIDMKPGRIYRVRWERVYGWRSRADYLWIEDSTTGQVVHGMRPE